MPPFNAARPVFVGGREPMNDEEVAFEAANYPLPIVGPDPVARACLFYLAGLGGSWSSGTVLNVSGGRLHGW